MLETVEAGDLFRSGDIAVSALSVIILFPLGWQFEIGPYRYMSISVHVDFASTEVVHHVSWGG